ncbi:MAG: type I methionyl aminopeptidase [Pseudomonadota bacterium]
MINIRTDEEIKILRDCNLIVYEVLSEVVKIVDIGLATEEIDKLANDICKKKKVKPAFLGYMGFPKSVCVSINDEVVHGIPSNERKLKKGDIISVDFGVIYKGFFGDSAVTIPVGQVSKTDENLMAVTKKALENGIEKAQIGNRISDISKAVQETAEKEGFGVVRDYVGHGIGRKMHESPQIPNFVTVDKGPALQKGMILAIEPMINKGTWKVKVLQDNWTVVTEDGQNSAHFEHSVAITENGPLVLSLP